MSWKYPSKIQAEAIPHALEGKDLIGLALTGSGKTGAFALPILQSLLDSPQPFFACVLSPTRELAIQIAEQFEALGAGIGVKCAVFHSNCMISNSKGSSRDMSGLDLVSWPARPVQQADPNHIESGSTPSVFAWINHDDKITFTLLLFPSSKLLLPKNFGTNSYEFINGAFA
ncbi:hypothetical protein SO802_026869 [Lithocarpus litseifolius]|uniref:Helicase ATP-binding domain-containing protein n=1 Tax=Lithocarpus litseifolius TaxID=425828 RepID=A0AAW2C0Z4_9ROSI